MKRRNTNPHRLKNATYYRMWQGSYRPFLNDDSLLLYMEFSLQYFQKLKRELESAGYEFTVDRYGLWFSDPVGYFGVSKRLKGESFVFFAM
jgi:hypothetical protein